MCVEAFLSIGMIIGMTNVKVVTAYSPKQLYRAMLSIIRAILRYYIPYFVCF